MFLFALFLLAKQAVVVLPLQVDAGDPMVHCARFFYGPMLQVGCSWLCLGRGKEHWRARSVRNPGARCCSKVLV
jgi:hypothetical protein